MIPITTFAGQIVAVFGLGRSGKSTAKALLAGGGEVYAWDDNAALREALSGEGIPLVDLANADWSQIAALVLAPGAPLTHPKPHWTVELATAANVPVLGDIELFFLERHRLAGKNGCQDDAAQVIAITGTNGKSTTTALIAHVLEVAGLDVQMGGNIGVPILELEPPEPGSKPRSNSDSKTGCVYVIEMSSYQIDLTPSLQPDIGVLLNLSPDHLDRHGSMANYFAIKARLVEASGHAIVGVDDEGSREIAHSLSRKGASCLPISGGEIDWGCFVTDHTVRLRETPAGELCELASIAGSATLRGRHNAQNAAATAAVAFRLGLSMDDLIKGLGSFPGLEHRMEEIGRVGRILFVNDSKATNADSAEKALESFSGGIFWIAGGLAKEGGIAELAAQFGRIEKAYLVGEAADNFAKTLEGHVAFVMSGSVECAVAQATADAKLSDARQPVVLLSPACASFDQFRSFEARGDAFRACVAGLDGVEMRNSGVIPGVTGGLTRDVAEGAA